MTKRTNTEFDQVYIGQISQNCHVDRVSAERRRVLLQAQLAQPRFQFFGHLAVSVIGCRKLIAYSTTRGMGANPAVSSKANKEHPKCPLWVADSLGHRNTS